MMGMGGTTVGKRRQLVIFIVAIVALFALIEAVGKPRSVPSGATPSAPAAVTAITLEYIYPRDRVDGFMATCNADGKHGPGCICLINKVQENFALAQFMDLRPGDPVSQAMASWGPACRAAQ